MISTYHSLSRERFLYTSVKYEEKSVVERLWEDSIDPMTKWLILALPSALHNWIFPVMLHEASLLRATATGLSHSSVVERLNNRCYWVVVEMFVLTKSVQTKSIYNHQVGHVALVSVPTTCFFSVGQPVANFNYMEQSGTITLWNLGIDPASVNLF